MTVIGKARNYRRSKTAVHPGEARDETCDFIRFSSQKSDLIRVDASPPVVQSRGDRSVRRA